ncbi:MAG: universal stress protein [Frankiaceae bacterium]|nr:universal stress protein [Frankiaceae bacterium]
MLEPHLPDSVTGALVVAVDDSPPALEALRFAGELAEGLGQPLTVLSVWNFVNGHGPAAQGDEPLSEAAWQAEAERRLDALLAAHPLPGVDVRAAVVHGNTTPTLLTASHVAHHLVIGSRGRGGFTGLLLGSTSDSLVRHASCPVTVVRRSASEGSHAH